MTVNKRALDLIKEFEGLRLDAYRDSVGVLTIGYGTTARAGVGIVPKIGMTITEVEAEYYLQKAVDKFADTIRPAITARINENEFGAYVSLAYNIGPTAFKKSSSLRHFNAGNKTKAAQNILLWNKAGGKILRGLVRRREAEKALFLTPVVAHIPLGVSADPPLRATPRPQAQSVSFWQAILGILFGKGSK